MSVQLPADRLLRIEDVAERLGISRSMAWKLVNNGALPCVEIGRSLRIRERDIELYILDHTTRRNGESR